MDPLSIRRLSGQDITPFSQYLLPQALFQAREAADQADVLGAVWGRFACGAAAVLWRGDRGEVLSLFVDPAVRRKGVAARLLGQIHALALERGVERLAASYSLAGEDLAAMDALFRRAGGEPAFRAPVFGMDSARFHDAPLLSIAFRPSFRPHSAVRTFSQLTREQLAALAEEPGIPGNLTWEACQSRADPALSVAWLQDGRVSAYALGGASGPDSYALLASWRSPDAPAHSFLSLLRAQVNLFYYRGGDFMYYTSALTENPVDLVELLTGGNYNLYEEHTVSWSPSADGGEQAGSQ